MFELLIVLLVSLVYIIANAGVVPWLIIGLVIGYFMLPPRAKKDRIG